MNKKLFLNKKNTDDIVVSYNPINPVRDWEVIFSVFVVINVLIALSGVGIFYALNQEEDFSEHQRKLNSKTETLVTKSLNAYEDRVKKFESVLGEDIMSVDPSF